MAQLEGMGFPTIRCQKALLATGNSDPETAMEWLFAHMEDPGMFNISDFIFPCADEDSNPFDVDIDSPIQPSAPAAVDGKCLRSQNHPSYRMLASSTLANVTSSSSSLEPSPFSGRMSSSTIADPSSNLST